MAQDHRLKVIVKNLPSRTEWTNDYLRNFLETVTPLVIAKDGIHVFMGYENTVLLTLEETLTDESFREAVGCLAETQFAKQPLMLERVENPTRSVLVYLTNNTVSSDYLHLYFNNPRESGCGSATVENCQVYPEQNLAIVRFSSPEAVSGVVSKGPHNVKMGAEPMKVEAWYEQFHGPLLDSLRYHRQPKQDSLLTTQRLCGATFREGLAKPSVEQRYFPPDRGVYQPLQKEPKKTQSSEVREMFKNIEQMLKQRDEEHRHRTVETDKPKTFSKEYVHVPAHKLRLLRDFVGCWKGCDMTFDEHEENIILYGSTDDRDEGKKRIFIELQRMHDASIDLSKGSAIWLTTPKGKQYLDEMIGKYVRCSVKVLGQSLLCAAFEAEKVHAFKKEFESSISHRTCKVPPTLIQSDEFKALKIKMEEGFSGLITVLDEDFEDVELDGDANAVKLVARKLENFTNQHQSDTRTFRIRGVLEGKDVREWFNDELEKVKLMISKERGESKESTDKCYTLTYTCRLGLLPDIEKELDAIKDSIVTVPVDLEARFRESYERALVINGLRDMTVQKFCLQVKHALDQNGQTGHCKIAISLPPKTYLPRFRLIADWDRRRRRGRDSLERELSSERQFSTSHDELFRRPWASGPKPGRRGRGLQFEGDQERVDASSEHQTPCTVRMGKTKITVKSGDITQEKVDVAVSVVGTNMNIRGTSLGSAFGQKCPGLEQELRTKGLGGSEDDDGHLIVTPLSGSDLPMSTLFHAVLCKSSHDDAMRTVKYVVQAALQRAVHEGLATIAFPPIGVGKRFHYRAYPVACTMVSAIQEFFLQNPDTFKAITIVMFDTTRTPTFAQVLKEKMKTANPGVATAASGGARFKRYTDSDSSKFFFDQAKSEPEDTPSTKLEAQVCTAGTQDIGKIAEILFDELKKTFLYEETSHEVEDFKKLGPEEIEGISKLAASTNVHISLNRKAIILCGQKQNVKDLLLEIRKVLHEQIKQKGWSQRRKLGLPVDTDRLPSYWKVRRKYPSIEYEAAIASWTTYGTDRTNRVSPVEREAVEKLVQDTWEADKVSHGSDAKGLPSSYTLKVLGVERVENPNLWRAYSRQREALFKLLEESDLRGFTPVEKLQGSTGPVATTAKIAKKGPLAVDIFQEVNEHYLFHGTKPDVLQKISFQGLDFRLSKHGMVGTGVYAAESSTKSDQYTDSKHERTAGVELKMILMRVLLGDAFMHTKEMGYKSYKRPPCTLCSKSQCKCTSSRLHNSVIFDSEKIFREFVTYDQHVCYPEYIITYARQ